MLLASRNKDIKYRHSNNDCRRSVTPHESMFSRIRGGFGFMGSNDRNLGGDSDQNLHLVDSLVQNLNAVNLQQSIEANNRLMVN
jgi:hypothetical protein